jgi:hypothetical protein
MGHCVVACHEAAGHLAASDLSDFGNRLADCFGSFPQPSRDPASPPPPPRVDFGCGSEDLKETVPNSESMLEPLQRDICEIKRSLDSLHQRSVIPKPVYGDLPCLRLESVRHFMERPGTWPVPGVISLLTAAHGGNVYTSGVIGIIKSSVYGAYLEQRIVEFGTDAPYCSNNAANEWIGYDFKQMRLLPWGYAVQTNESAVDVWHMRSWVIEATNDEKFLTEPGLVKWKELDSQNDNADLNGKFQSKSYPLSPASLEPFRFIRLRMREKCHDDKTYWLYLAGLEFLGELLIAE